MSTWGDLEAAYNSAAFAAFGPETAGSITYQSPLYDALDLTNAIRLTRDPLQLDQAGSFEGLYVSESDFPLPPAIGDRVQMDGASYVVSDIRNPNPYESNKVLVLTRTVKALPGQ